MAKSEDEDFEKTVAKFLSEGLHTRHDLTAEEYTAVCRKAWDECHASLEFPFKVLIDPLHSIEEMLGGSTRNYIHWRAADEIEALREPSMEIRCEAMGLRNPDLSAAVEDEPPLPSEEPNVPESRRYILAVFDVLGFSALVTHKGLAEITALYSELITKAVTIEAMRIHTIIRFSETQKGSIWGALPVKHAHFSDTILLWVPLVQHFIDPFIARCADMVCEALKMRLPLRGAIAVGPAVMHSRTGTFVGAPIVEAAKLEESQDWLGVSLGPSMLASDVSCEFDPTLVVPYRVPFKKGKKRVYVDLALDWPNRFRARFGTDPIDAIRAIDTSPAHHIYYDNAVKFAEFSAGPIFRSDGFQPPNLGELADAAVEARRTGTPLDRQHKFRLKDLSRSGAVGDSVAQFIRSIAAGEEPPPVPSDLPKDMQRYFREVSLAVGGTAKFFKMVPCAVEVVSMRLRGTPLTQDAEATLKELEQYGSDGREVAEFLRELSTGRAPAVPRKLSKGMGPFLKRALAWVNEAKVPLGLLRHVAEEYLNARMRHNSLDEDTLRALAALDATNETWASVAAFLRGISSGEDPPVPDDLPEPANSDLIRISLASRVAGVQPPRTLEIMSVGFGDPATGVDLFSLVHGIAALKGQADVIPEEAEKAIRQFERAAPERAVVGHRLRSLITGEPAMETQRSLPVAIRFVLAQIEAVSNGKAIPLDPSLVGLAAIRMRHGGGKMGDCIMFSLHAMARGDTDTKMLANYLWSIANRGPAGPAPILTKPWLAATAEEVRCLAETQVGGIRMMMRRAKPGKEEQAADA